MISVYTSRIEINKYAVICPTPPQLHSTLDFEKAIPAGCHLLCEPITSCDIIKREEY